MARTTGSHCRGLHAVFSAVLLAFSTVTAAVADTEEQQIICKDPSFEAVSALDAESAAMAVLAEYLAALNRLDLEGVTNCYHFPHVRVVGVDLVIWETPLEAMPLLALPKGKQKAALQQGLGEGWHKTVWGKRQLISASDDKVHIATELLRQRDDGTLIHRFESFYVVTLEQGRWAIKGRSSYAPK